MKMIYFIINAVMAAGKRVGWWGGLQIGFFLAEKLYDGELKASIYSAIATEAMERAGLDLDKNDPLSDASMAAAIGARVGFPLRSLKDKDVIAQDIDRYVVGIIESRTGYKITSLMSAAGLKDDLTRIASVEMTVRLGLPVGVMPADGEAFDAAAIKGRLLVWAKAELMTQMEGEIQAVLAEIESSGDVLAMANGLNLKLSQMGSGENVTARQIAVRVASQIATRSVVDYQKAAVVSTKRGRRQESLRRAQEKFRKKWGNRAQYVPVGWTAHNPDPPVTG